MKRTLNHGERRLSSDLVYESRMARERVLEKSDEVSGAQISEPEKTVPIVITAPVTADLLEAISRQGGVINAVAPTQDQIEATVSVSQLEILGARSEVRGIRRPSFRWTNVGSANTQGYIAHRANQVVALGQTGAGIKVGVLSDSALPARVAALMGSGDLGPGTTVLEGQQGPETGTDEGAAMMEIVQDIAPGCQLYFATAYTGESSFAANILALAAAGCRVIVDDVHYSDEFPFQDSILAKAVNSFVASGGIYFSAAGDANNKTNENSTTWEGDFKDGGTLISGPVANYEGEPVVVHDFGTAQTLNRFVGDAPAVALFWANPIGESSDDYDLFVIDALGSKVKGVSAGVQDGTQNPVEIAYSAAFGAPSFLSGDRIVVVRTAGSARRAIHLGVLGGVAQLSINTPGQVHGHSAAEATQSIAATYWNSAHTGTRPFTGFGNPTEPFGSDGPRRIFFNPDGSAITPGNFLFATKGGRILQKPDFTAADGVSVRTPGFNPFYGTSASAAHAAGIAALVLGANPALTNTQVVSILRRTALDNGPQGWDRDGGFGVLTALAAVQAAQSFSPETP